MGWLTISVCKDLGAVEPKHIWLDWEFWRGNGNKWLKNYY